MLHFIGQDHLPIYQTDPHTPSTFLLTNPKTADQLKTNAVILYHRGLGSGLPE